MSKSLGNFYTLNDIEEKGVSPMALKLLFLGAHYRDELNFTWDSLLAAQRGYEKLQRRVWALLEQSAWSSLAEVPELDPTMAPEEYAQFRAYLEDDLKTAQAVATLWKVLKVKDPAVLPLVKHMLDAFGLELPTQNE